MQHIENSLITAARDLYKVDIQPELTRPDEQFGDYASNIALRLAGQVGQPPRQIAEALVEKLRASLGEDIKAVSVAGPGFINLTLSDAALWQACQEAPHVKPKVFEGQNMVLEYSDPNPFKALHAGHLYTTVVGDVLSRLVEVAGAKEVHRVNFGGDVGPHVARAMWGILTYAGKGQPDAAAGWRYMQELSTSTPKERAVAISSRYVEGNTAYENDADAKESIIELNKKIYQLHEVGDRESDLAKIYWLGRQWSYDFFEAFYKEFGVHQFEKYYPESATAPLGTQIVHEQLQKGVYEKSDGAVIFHGEKYGLHTRVFINAHGLPTYEAKDVGLIMAKWQDYHFDKSVIITGDDIVEYMKVVLKSIEQFAPELAQRSLHLTHGMLKLERGVKMSSRRGNVLYADDILHEARKAAKEAGIGSSGAHAAVKYALLKQRIGGEIIYNPKESVSLEGNSGPYLQYAHARACAVLQKVAAADKNPAALEPFERSLTRKLTEYPEVLQKAASEYAPHHICTYLYELAQTFNRFYEHSRVVGDLREGERAAIVRLYAHTLKNGLTLLGIDAPEHV